MKLKIKNIFDFEKWTLQSLKSIPWEYDFITASEERKTHNLFSHDWEFLIFAMWASWSLWRTHYVNWKFISSDLCFILSPKKDLKTKINMNFFHTYFNVIKKDIVKNTATWTSKIAINQKNFWDYELFLPEISFQNDFYEKFKDLKIQNDELILITDKNLSYIKQLKQAILQEAIEWKLTKSWRENNPNIESAKILLEKIQKEKEELVKQKKLKKQEKLKEISQDEIPFEIPENWSWCRLGNIVINRWWKRVPKWHLLLDTKTNHIYIRVTDMNKWTVNLNNLKYISDETFQVIKNYTISKDDVYLTIAWTIWRVWIVPDELDNMNLTENATKLTPIFVDKYFLKLFLETPFIQSIFQEAIVQMAQPKLALMRIDITLFPLPPLEEQKEIVKKVDEMMKLCDELEKQSLETKENSENLMKSVLSEVFSR